MENVVRITRQEALLLNFARLVAEYVKTGMSLEEAAKCMSEFKKFHNMH